MTTTITRVTWEREKSITREMKWSIFVVARERENRLFVGENLPPLFFAWWRSLFVPASPQYMFELGESGSALSLEPIRVRVSSFPLFREKKSIGDNRREAFLSLMWWWCSHKEREHETASFSWLCQEERRILLLPHPCVCLSCCSNWFSRRENKKEEKVIHTKKTLWLVLSRRGEIDWPLLLHPPLSSHSVLGKYFQVLGSNNRDRQHISFKSGLSSGCHHHRQEWEKRKAISENLSQISPTDWLPDCQISYTLLYNLL